MGPRCPGSTHRAVGPRSCFLPVEGTVAGRREELVVGLIYAEQGVLRLKLCSFHGRYLTGFGSGSTEP